MSEISYLTINNAHNGVSIKITKPVRFHHLQEFKRYLQQSFSIDNIDNLFLITSYGIKLNYGLINEISDIFVYDKRLFANSVDPALVNQYTLSNFHVNEPKKSPLATSNDNFLKQNVSSTLKINQGWARALSQDSSTMEEYCREMIKEINIIFKGLSTIFQFATNFTSEIEKNFNNFYNYIKLINYKTLHKSWLQNYRKLQSFPTFKIDSHTIRISEYLDADKLKNLADYIDKFLPLIVKKFNELGDDINNVNDDKLKIDKFIESSRNESIKHFKDVNVQNLLEKVQAVTKNIVDDVDRLGTSDVNQIYKTHRDTYSVAIYENAKNIYKNFKDLEKFKSQLLKNSLQTFNTIANLQMKMVGVKTEMRKLSEEGSAGPEEEEQEEQQQDVKKYEDHLSLTIDMPLLFGFALIEKRRQFEWTDFYAKGIVNNASEQFSTIIDHERRFREIWWKKFGSFLSSIDNQLAPPGSLPHIDVTLVSNKQQTFSILQDLKIERDDIIKYIALVESSHISKNFVDLLNKNFKDLIKCTNNMKKVTRVVSSLSTFTSFTADEKSKQLTDGETDEAIDFDLNLIKGLKSRIKKLENLLHQQQYRNINNWPVIRNGSSMTVDNRMSTIIQPKVTPTPPTSNPTQLLSRRSSAVANHTPKQSQTLDSSVIDKHLDNIRLKKSNAELQTKNEELVAQLKAKDKLIEQLREQMTNKESESKKTIDDLNEKLNAKEEEFRTYKLDNKLDQKEVEALNKKLATRDNQISELELKVLNFTELTTSSSKEVSNLNQTITTLRSELNDAMHMKNDLLSNLSAKEAEFSKERNLFSSDLKNLQAKLDEVSEDYENLMELTQTKQKRHDLLINDLNNVIINLMNDIKQAVQEVFQYFLEYCLVLESMGLLLVNEENMYKIKRVKGLKSKKGSGEEDMSIISVGAPSSKVIEEIEEEMNWLEQIPPLSSILPDSYSSGNEGDSVVDRYHDQSLKLISVFNDIFKFDTDNGNKFDHFLNTLSFKSNVQLQEDSINSSRFFLNSIAKRFRDVEGFAKRQTKENKSKEQDLKKLNHRLNHKITLNGFQHGDLVLFLPTRIDRPNGEVATTDEKSQTWAAFNIGAPHYFMKTDRVINKDWFIGRVKKIIEHKVTEENFNSTDANPYQLSIGVVWYMVETDEEKNNH
ncbi:ATG11 Autophagy-related protein 11 [Candida maltosa Xu316]